ncbi:DUF4743 domain-containing protein [Chromatium okenii]|uniref:DUF4743 domain-containing protein n=1 Tax=Chromatium okenii TaxID=61644 RepID=A0A2S7XRW0_9GAMM|nr:DUF4743 domain-containing protein [Chromatium okenii]PQJ96162.1 DUF4743 domain-containing protein [Chromatium okenii]
MGFLGKIRACNTWNPLDFLPFTLNGERIGNLHRGAAAQLRRWPQWFAVTTDAVHWINAPACAAERTATLAEVVDQLVANGLITHCHGELYPVTASTRAQSRCLIDRAAAPFFGMRAFGQHLNGFVRTAHGIEMWIGQRSATRRHYPGYLDHLVAGGLPAELSLAENLRKECAEEAGMAAVLANQAIAVSAVSYCQDSARGLKPDVMYCYDLELQEDFVPRCTDGEVENFRRIPVRDVLELVCDSDAFKLNCNLVLIDFLIRHGFITPEEQDYLELVHGLRAKLP